MPPKKKLSKKERARLEAEQAELLRIELEKENQRKLEEERRRREIERQQAIKRQQEEICENRKRRAQLKNSMSFFNAIKDTIDSINETAKEQRDWEKFMRCNGLPNANSPSDLRKYMHQWNSDIEIRNKNSRNWLLQTDERTLLTQDTNIPDLSRTALRKLQGNLGDTYAKRIKEVFGILIEIDEAITDEKKPIHIARDLHKLKTEMRLFLKEYLDEFTYKTMSHIERDMEIDRPGVYRHIYISDVYKSHIWTYSKDAQLSVNAKARVGEQNQHITVVFPTVGIEIQLPPTVILYNSAMRGLWLNFDHFSDYCPTFSLKKAAHKNIDILYQTKKEWLKRKEILKNLIEECSLQSPIITDIAKVDSTATKKSKERTFDIDKIYMGYEEQLNKARKRAIGPEAYNSLETDVNLRKYRIIGGVYCIDHIETPDQDKRLNSRSFIRTIVAPDKLGYKDFYQMYKPPPPTQPGVRRLPEEIEAEMRLIEAALDKLALVTVQLPDTVIWFEPPIACRWETECDTLESNLAEGVKQKDTEITSFIATNTTPLRSSPHFLSKLCTESSKNPDETLPIRVVMDFDMLNIPHKIDIYGFLTDFVVPRLPQGFSLHFEHNLRDISSQKSQEAQQQKIVFLTRHKNVHITRTTPKDEPSHFEERKVNRKSINFKEPQALFPLVKLKKSLTFRENQNKTGSKDDKILENSKRSSFEKSTTIGETISSKNIYLFSELIEDLNSLIPIQTPLQLEVDQMSANPTNPSSTDHSEISVPIAQTNNMESMDKVLSACPRIPGLSLLCNLDRMQPRTQTSNECDNIENEITQSDGDDSSSAFEDEWEEEFDQHSMDSLNKQAQIDSDSSNVKKSKIVSVDTFQRGKWSTRDVHDVKFNEDKFSIQFRTGRFGIFGFALNRYSNMPYQTWEIKPDFKNPDTILFSLTASIVSMEITISSAGYCMNSFQGGSTEAITNIIGKICSLKELRNTLISSAVDIFPDQDAFCYTEGSCEKNYLMEIHLYACISTLGLSHNFSWSRWNLLAGNRTAVLLMRELIEGKKVPYHSTLLVTPLKTAIIDCTEVSASFNTSGISGMEYYADLYQLSQNYAQPSSLQKQRTMNPTLRDNVACLLMAIRPLSLC